MSDHYEAADNDVVAAMAESNREDAADLLAAAEVHALLALVDAVSPEATTKVNADAPND